MYVVGYVYVRVECGIACDVRVPVANLVGEENKGWTIAKRLLQFERDATTNNRRQLAGDTRPVGEIAKEYVGVDEQGRIADPDIRARVVKHMMNFEALKLMQGRMLHRPLLRDTRRLCNLRRAVMCMAAL